MVKKKYKCMKHKYNNGYVDNEGIWHCWKCTKENRYFYPGGSVIEKYTSNDSRIEVRIVSTGPHTVRVEVWFIDRSPQVLDWSEHHSYLSTAMRTFEGLVVEIESGNYSRNNSHTTDRHEIHQILEEELEQDSIDLPSPPLSESIERAELRLGRYMEQTEVPTIITERNEETGDNSSIVEGEYDGRLVINFMFIDFALLNTVFTNSIFYRCEIPIGYYDRLTTQNNRFYDCRGISTIGAEPVTLPYSTASRDIESIINRGVVYMLNNLFESLNMPINSFIGGNEE